MSVQQVPQDVEVADKILGPLTLKQFIFAVLFCGCGYLGYVLFQASPILVIIVLPPMIIFGTLAFYHRQDQPVEVYLASALRFYLKPHTRVWSQDGYEKHVDIVAPKAVGPKRTKNLTDSDIKSNLDRLSKIMDTGGWASKNIDSLDRMGVSTSDSQHILNVIEINSVPGSEFDESDKYDQNHDILDENSTTIARQFSHMVERSTQQNRQATLARLQQSRLQQPSKPAGITQTPPTPAPVSPTPSTNIFSSTPSNVVRLADLAEPPTRDNNLEQSDTTDSLDTNANPLATGLDDTQTDKNKEAERMSESPTKSNETKSDDISIDSKQGDELELH